MSEALAGLHRGSYVAPTRQTVRQFLEAWIVTAKSELAITAWTNYAEVLDRYVLPYLGGKLLTDLSPLDIKKWHGDLLDHGRKDGTPLAANSVKLAHRVLHRALADGVRWNIIATNPASSVRLPKQPHREMKVWTPEQAANFLHALGDDRLVPLWTVALDTGMRRGELAGLRWSDVDLEHAVLTVSQQRTTASYETVIAAPKAQPTPTPPRSADRGHSARSPKAAAWRKGGVGSGVDRQRLRVRRRRRSAAPSAARHQALRRGHQTHRRSEDPTPRPPAHDGHHCTRCRRPSEGRARATRSRHDQRHPRYLLAPPSSRPQRQRRNHRKRSPSADRAGQRVVVTESVGSRRRDRQPVR